MYPLSSSYLHIILIIILNCAQKFIDSYSSFLAGRGKRLYLQEFLESKGAGSESFYSGVQVRGERTGNNDSGSKKQRSVIYISLPTLGLEEAPPSADLDSPDTKTLPSYFNLNHLVNHKAGETKVYVHRACFFAIDTGPYFPSNSSNL